MSSFQLSKTTYLYGCQCTKRLWLHRYRPQLKDVLTAEQAQKFQRGIDFGQLAQQLFPGGIDVSPDKPWFYDQSAQKTKALLDTGHPIIYEATFIYNGVMCAVDILVMRNDEAHIFEVKNTHTVSDIHIADAALQYWIIKQCGLPVAGFNIIHRNKEYSIPSDTEPDLQQLFVQTPVLEKLYAQQDAITANINTFKHVLAAPGMPVIAMGAQCDYPYPCDFKGFCTQQSNFVL